MTKEEINNLFKKYNVSLPKDKHGQSECKSCKEEHKYSLTWTSFLYEYKEHYYCYEHIVIFLLEKENQELKKQLEEKIKIGISDHKYASKCEDKVVFMELNQRKFIKYLEDMLDSENDIFSVVRVKDILQKYKEIMRNID